MASAKGNKVARHCPDSMFQSVSANLESKTTMKHNGYRRWGIYVWPIRDFDGLGFERISWYILAAGNQIFWFLAKQQRLQV
jgi:hypothetical protein